MFTSQQVFRYEVNQLKTLVMKTKKVNLLLLAIFTSLTLLSQESIYDIQFTDDPYGISPFENEIVTVTGIVAASAKEYDLGFVFIQDEGGGPWSGIWIDGGGVQNLYRNEEVTVTGTVVEYQGITALVVTSYELTGKLKEVVVTEMDPSDSAASVLNGWEKWESVLVQYKSPDQSKLYISHPKPNGNNDYGEYAVSPKSKKMPKRLGLILAGRVTSSIFSSLYVSIVSDLAWYDNSGQMQVDPIEASTNMEMDGVIGIMTYQFGDYKLLPRNNDDFVNINVELEETALPGSPLGIEEFEKKTIRAFPNPASDFIELTTDETISEISLFNLTGQMVLNQKQTGQTQQINVSALQQGTYFLQLKTEKNELISTKVVILH
jgi:hypothetical protein